ADSRNVDLVEETPALDELVLVLQAEGVPLLHDVEGLERAVARLVDAEELLGLEVAGDLDRSGADRRAGRHGRGHDSRETGGKERSPHPHWSSPRSGRVASRRSPSPHSASSGSEKFAQPPRTSFATCCGIAVIGSTRSGSPAPMAEPGRLKSTD